MEKVKLPAYVKAFFVLALIFMIIYTLIVGKSVLIPLLLSAYISMLLTPFCNWMERNKVPSVLSTLIALTGSLAAIVGIIYLIITQLSSFINDFEDVSGRINTYLIAIDEFVIEMLDIKTGISNGINQSMIVDFIQGNSKSISQFLIGTVGSLTSILLLPIFIFFLLLYRDRIMNFAVMLYAHKDPETVKNEIVKLRKVIQYYLSGVFKVMIILTILNTAALMIIGVNHAIFFGSLSAVLNIIPYVGPFIAATLPIIYATLTMDGLFYPLAIFIALITIQAIEGNILTPKIVGKTVNLNPLISIIALLVGASIWGAIGMILIIPTLAIISRMLELDPQTKPYAYLMGDKEKERLDIQFSQLLKKKKRAKKSDENEVK